MSSAQRALETTPRGVAKWITVNTPDTKFKDEGEYRVTLLLKGKEADALKAKIDNAIKMAVVEAKANPDNAKHKKVIKPADAPYKADVDKEGNETGFTAFNFKAKASGVRKDKTEWTFKPRVFDVSALPIDLTKVQVWGGSEVKVSYEMSLYGVRNYSPKVGAGVSLKLAAVQILQLKTGTGKDASAFGFAAEEAPEGEEAPAHGTPSDNEEF